MKPNIKEKLIAQTRVAIEHYKTLDLSLNMILEQTGVSKGSFYYYFKNRDDLIYQAALPILKKQKEIIQKKILECTNLRDKFYYLFLPLIDDKSKANLKYLEGFYDYLFFKGNINKSTLLRKIYIESREKRKLMILQSIESIGIKPDKEMKTLVNYIIDTIVFYHLSYKSLYNKNPKREIIEFINIICNIIESKLQNKGVTNGTKTIF